METQHSADRVIGRILEACEIIDDYPRVGRRFEELTDADWRCVVCGRYLIFYSIADSVVIERILDGRRDYLTVLMRRAAFLYVQGNCMLRPPPVMGWGPEGSQHAHPTDQRLYTADVVLEVVFVLLRPFHLTSARRIEFDSIR